MHINPKDSNGVAFLSAASQAFPKSIGDREYVHAMHRLMEIVVQSRMVFSVQDGKALRRLAYRTCVGHFDPLAENWYARACVAGGTYPAMWEKHHGMRPWKATMAIHKTPGVKPYGYVQTKEDDFALHAFTLLPGNRVFPGMAVLFQTSMEDDPDYELTRLDNYPLGNARDPDTPLVSGEVWWVSSFSNGHITLCRYRSGKNTPARRKKLTRDEWQALNAA